MGTIAVSGLDEGRVSGRRAGPYIFSHIWKRLVFSSSCQKLEGTFGGRGGAPGGKTRDRVVGSQNWPPSVSFSPVSPSSASSSSSKSPFEGSYPFMVLAASIPDELYAA